MIATTIVRDHSKKLRLLRCSLIATYSGAVDLYICVSYIDAQKTEGRPRRGQLRSGSVLLLRIISIVVYHTRIPYRTRMVHTVRVYAYGTTVRVWYGYLYHMRIAVLYYKQHIYSYN